MHRNITLEKKKEEEEERGGGSFVAPILAFHLHFIFAFLFGAETHEYRGYMMAFVIGNTSAAYQLWPSGKPCCLLELLFPLL